jgi:superfamily II DNA or RNA helicase
MSIAAPEKSFFDLEGNHLREYQKAAIRSFISGAAAGHQRQIIQKPTGVGKTITGLGLARKIGRTLWLAHREELIDQPIETLSSLWPECVHGVVKQGRDRYTARDIVFASVQSAVRRLARDWGEFALIVVDEVHHAAARTYKAIIDRFAPPGSKTLVVGLTATPERGDKKNLAKAGFTAFAYRMTLHEAIECEFLVPYIAERIVLPGLDLSKVPIVAGDFDREKLKEELERVHAAEKTAEAIVARCGGRKMIVFTASVDQARKTAEELQRLGLAAGWVCGETPKDERRKTLQDLKSGAIQVVANAMVLTEGFDDPSLGGIAVARPTKSKGLYIQMVGRGLRKYPMKLNCLILDLVGAHDLHGLQMAGRLGAPQTKEERDIETAGLPVLDEFGGEPEEEEKEPPASIEGVIVSRFLAAATAGPSSGRQTWIEAAPGIFALPCGDRNVALFEDGGKWRAEVGNMKIIETSDLSLAQGAAEDYARSQKALGLSAKDAAWRTREPSAGQLRLMKQLNVFYADGTLTQGEASDLITAAKVRKQYVNKIRENLL